MIEDVFWVRLTKELRSPAGTWPKELLFLERKWIRTLHYEAYTHEGRCVEKVDEVGADEAYPDAVFKTIADKFLRRVNEKLTKFEFAVEADFEANLAVRSVECGQHCWIKRAKGAVSYLLLRRAKGTNDSATEYKDDDIRFEPSPGASTQFELPIRYWLSIDTENA